MHITNKKICFDIFTVEKLLNIFMEHPNDFCHKIKMYNFEPYSVLLAIATNIAVQTLANFLDSVSKYNKKRFF